MDQEVTPRAQRFVCSLALISAFIAVSVWLCREMAHRARRVEAVQEGNAVLAARLARLQGECKMLHGLREALRDDPFVIEKKARRTFGWVREGEQSYTRGSVSLDAPPEPQAPDPAHTSRVGRVLRRFKMDRHAWRFYLLTGIFSAMGVVLVLGAVKPGGAGSRPPRD